MLIFKAKQFISISSLSAKEYGHFLPEHDEDTNVLRPIFDIIVCRPLQILLELVRTLLPGVDDSTMAGY